jgi:D-alanyl-D-alanine carboxypeptidase
MAVLEETSKIKTLSEIMTKREYYLTGYKENKPPKIIKIHSTDRLLKKNIVRVLAGKTGYTDLARYCLAILVETEDNRRLGMVFLGAEGRFTRFADVERVLQWIDRVKKNSSRSPNPTLATPATLEAASLSRPSKTRRSTTL